MNLGWSDGEAVKWNTGSKDLTLTNLQSQPECVRVCVDREFCPNPSQHDPLPLYQPVFLTRLFHAQFRAQTVHTHTQVLFGSDIKQGSTEEKNQREARRSETKKQQDVQDIKLTWLPRFVAGMLGWVFLIVTVFCTFFNFSLCVF